MKRTIILFLGILILICNALLCACKNGEENSVVTSVGKAVEYTESTENLCIDENIDKGHNLLINDEERKEAERDCKKQLELIADIHKILDKDIPSNAVLSDETLTEMSAKIAKTGSCVRITEIYSNMENYDKFLKSCIAGNRGDAVIYAIHPDGGIDRDKYIFDGNDMYLLAANAAWDNAGKSSVSYISYTRLKEWRYSDKGWFCYELCVPEYPEVTEIIDGSCLVRVKPISEENRKMSEKCVLVLGYQGNNLLHSDWDINSMANLDYNGLYEYLYAMKNQQRFSPEDYPYGIPKEEFESLIMYYLPITSEKIKEYAVFDEENQTYVWNGLGCFTYAPTFFGTSIPEVVDIKENEDGTTTLTVDAVCEMVLCDTAVITHKLTVKFEEDGSFRYISNQVQKDGLNTIPEYQYRLKQEVPADFIRING